MKGLTAKQQAIWDMHETGKSQTEGAALLGISVPVYHKGLAVCRKKLGLTFDKASRAVENKNPERFAAIVDAATDPLMKLQEAMEANGVPDRAAQALLRRIRMKFFDTVTATKNLKKIELDEMIGQKIHLMLSYLDDKVAGEASARDLAMGISQLVEKQQLIRGEPTQIISDHERKKLNELAPLLMLEVQRRGLTIDVTPEVVSAA